VGGPRNARGPGSQFYTSAFIFSTQPKIALTAFAQWCPHRFQAVRWAPTGDAETPGQPHIALEKLSSTSSPRAARFATRRQSIAARKIGCTTWDHIITDFGSREKGRMRLGRCPSLSHLRVLTLCPCWKFGVRIEHRPLWLDPNNRGPWTCAGLIRFETSGFEDRVTSTGLPRST
jgi:hypothetical protein